MTTKPGTYVSYGTVVGYKKKVKLTLVVTSKLNLGKEREVSFEEYEKLIGDKNLEKLRHYLIS